MKKRKNSLGLVGRVLVGSSIIIGSLIPSFAKAQTVSSPENYEDASYRAKMLPYCKPNLHLTEGKDSLDYDHSGDANGDGNFNSNDSEVMRNGTYTNLIKADFYPDSIINEKDADIADSVLNNQKERRWEYMNRYERIDYLRNVLSTDSRNYPPRDDIYWDCTNYVRAHQKGFFGIEDEDNSNYGDDELYGTNANKNIPLYSVTVTAGGVNHKLAGVLVGQESGERLSEDPENFSHWYFWNPSGPNELNEVKPGDANFDLNSSADIIWYGKMLNGSHSSTSIVKFDGNQNHIYSHDYLIPFNPASEQEEITQEGVPEDVVVNYQSDIDLSQYIEQMPDTAYAKSNLPISLEKVVSENIPLNQEYPNHHYKKQITYKASTGYKNSIVVRKIEVKDMEKPEITNFPEDNQKQYSVSLDLENEVNTNDLNTQDNSGLEVTLEKSTESTQVMNGTIDQVNFDFYTDITIRDKFDNDTTYTHKTEVRDTEGPTAYLRDNYIRRESGQTVEEAVNSLVENIQDNSELEVKLLVENTADNYYNVELEDFVGNKTYLGNVQVDNPVGIDEPSDLEIIKVFPNPADKIIYLQSNQDVRFIKLLNINGIIIHSGIYKEQFDVSNLNSGIYLLEFYNRNKELLTKKKLLIE